MAGVAFTKPRQLMSDDALEGFSCGVDVVDDWLHRRARTARRAGTAVVYVSFHEGQLAGFYTLSSQSIDRSDVGGWLARNAPSQVPVILLGMLGVDHRWQGEGLGRSLLIDAAQRAHRVAHTIGARALVVDPADDAARAFYARNGFKSIPGCDRMFAKFPEGADE